MKGRPVFGFAGGGEGNPPVFFLLQAKERKQKRELGSLIGEILGTRRRVA
jgi:hypothetical protein